MIVNCHGEIEAGTGPCQPQEDRGSLVAANPANNDLWPRSAGKIGIGRFSGSILS
jgi:hypothetical protein